MGQTGARKKTNCELKGKGGDQERIREEDDEKKKSDLLLLEQWR